MAFNVAGVSALPDQEGVHLSEPRNVKVHVWLGCDLKAADAEEGVCWAETLFCLRC